MQRTALRLAMTTVTAGLMLAAAIPVAAASSADSEFSATLKHRGIRNWTIQLPAEQWFAVGDGIGIPHANGDAFRVSLEGTDLKIDTDGDGVTDRVIKTTPNDFGERHARVALRGESADGEPFTYVVRLLDAGQGWMWAPGGAMTGMLQVGGKSAKVQLFDRNGNGRYDDIGEDAMIIGSGHHATLLSRTMHIGGELWTIDISPAGDAITATQYDGPVSHLDMTTGLSSQARLVSAVIKSADGAHSFDVARAEGPMPVPAGEYEIVTGEIALGQQSVRVGKGRAEAIRAEAGKQSTFDWGGPVASEFRYQRAGDQVIFSPDAIWYYGDAGEEYFGWSPIGKSPQFSVVNRDTGQVLEVLILPGSC